MSREHDGWEYVNGRPRWAPTTESVIAELTYDKYGEEYEWWTDKLADIVRAAQRDAAELLKKAGHTEAAEMIFPDYPQEDDSE